MSIHLLSNIQSPSLSVFYVTIFLIRSRLVFVAYQTTDSFTVVSFHLYVIVEDWYVISTASTTIFQRPLFVAGRLGRGKNDGNDDGKKKRGSDLFPLPIVHRELFFFFFWMRYFHWSTEREPLRRTTCISSLSRLQYVLLWDESDNSVGCGRAVFTPILGSWRFFPLYFPPIMRYIRSQYTGMRYWKQCLQAQPTRLSKVRPRFSRSSSRCAFPTSSKPGYLSWGWEQVTEGRHKIRST